MTLLAFDGCQDSAVMAKSIWDALAVAQTGRDASTNGAFSIAATNGTRTATLPSAAATLIWGQAFFPNGASLISSTSSPFVRFVRSGTTELVLIVNASGFIEVRRTNGTGTLIGTTSGHTPIAASVWFHLQAKVLLATGSGGSVEIVLNGATVLTVAGAATAGSSGSVTAIINATGSGNAVYFDDLYVCDAVGSAPYSDYLGDVGIKTLVPTSDGSASAWTPSTGSNHSALVDEVPPNTTDYNASGTATQQDLYNVTDLPAAATTVLAVQVAVYAAKTDAGAASVKPLVRENSTTTAQTAIPLSTTYAGYYGAILTARPSDSAAFTVSDVNALQVGVEAA